MVKKDETILLLCKFREDTLVFKLTKDVGFSEFKSRLGMNWNINDCDALKVSYSIPNHPSCFLRNKDEFDSMFSLVEVLNLHCVNINVYVDGIDSPFTGDRTVEGCTASAVRNTRSLHETTTSSSVASLIGSSTSGINNKASLNTITASEDAVSASVNRSAGDISASVNRSRESLSHARENTDTFQATDGNVNRQEFVEDASLSRAKVLLSSHWSSLLTHVGQVFKGGIPEFRSILCKYSVEVGFKFTYVKNNKRKVCVQCSEKYKQGCNWYVCASVAKTNGCCYVKKFQNEHTCGVILSNGDTKKLSYSKIADLLLETVRGNSGLCANDAVNLLLTNYGLTVSYKKVWRALDKAKSMIFGDFCESFKELGWYVEAAMTKNPGSHIILEVNKATNKFQRIFVSFNACIKGFQFCRPLLFVDGTFVKGKFKGCILSATGKDGNQGLYPLAFAIVDSKNQDNWLWFFTHIRNIIGQRRQISFVSDRNAGLLAALPTVFPNANHFFCIQHLKNNLRDKFSSGSFSNSFREHMVWLFRECAYASTERVFKEKLDELKEKGGSIVERFLEGLPFQNWTNVYRKGCRYGEMSSNAAESFNAWIVEARELPITHMVDTIKFKLMNRFFNRRTEAARWNGALCPKMAEKFNAYINDGRTWNVKKSSQSNFEVFSDTSVSVDIEKGTCSCQQWQLNGFPCVHAALAITRSSYSIDQIVELYFHMKNFQSSYEECIIPVPTIVKDDFIGSDDNEILAPSTKRPPRRPKKRRFRSRGEFVKRIRCGRCGKLGTHNRKTCSEPLA